MSPQAALRSVLASIVAFAVVAIVFTGLIGGSMAVESGGRDTAVGIAALLAPLAAAAAGAWQARAAGVARPLLGVIVPAVVALLLGWIVFATNETTSDSLNTLQPILVLVGAIAGAGVYAVRWFGTTSAR